jgi:hypothetical protein
MPRSAAIRSSAKLAVALAIAAHVEGCASSPSGSAGPSIMQSSQGQPAPATVEWSGKFATMTKQSGDVSAIRGQTNITGDVTLTALAENRLKAEIDIANTNAARSELFWALVSGRCGSNSIPTLTVNQFPVIEVNSSGRGRVSGEVPLGLPTSGTYHVNLYLTHGGDESDVLSCANLRMIPRK